MAKKITTVNYYVCEPGTDTTDLSVSQMDLNGKLTLEQAQKKLEEISKKYDMGKNVIQVKSVFYSTI